jgi:hypothetical protein
MKMNFKHISIYFGLLLLMNACIESYIIHVGQEDLKKYIVSGQVSDQEGYHYVKISLGSSIEDPDYILLPDCEVVIKDNENHAFVCEEYEEGMHRAWIDQEYLYPGATFMVSITTSAGTVIESDFDEIPVSPEIDTIYFEYEDIPTSNPDWPRKGIQFYMDFEAEDSDSRNYMWELTETWEYHAFYARTMYYDGMHHQIMPADSSHYYCWTTKKLNNIFTLSTQNLAENKYLNYPFHYVDNRSPRLEYMYSLLIKQYALSDSAFLFWDQMRLNNDAGAGLYEQQPLSIKGNMRNLTNPDIEVLGFFMATAVKEKRLFFENIDLELDYYGCRLEEFDFRVGWKGYDPAFYPIYYILEDNVIPWILGGICIDCTSEGGTNVKPDYWPR